MATHIQRKYNLIKSRRDVRDHIHVSPFIKVLPSAVDLRDELPPVLDQGQLGSCALNATSNCLRHLLMKEQVHIFQPSRLYLYWNTRVNIEHSPAGEDTGVMIRDVCKAIQKYHACDEAIWPYDIAKFNIAPPLKAYKNANLHKQLSYARVHQTVKEIKQAIASHFPVIIGIGVYESFEGKDVAETGIVPVPDPEKETLLGGHALLAVGYDDDKEHFIVQNSWGEYWGDKGFCYIPYKYLTDKNLASDFWTITLFE